MSTAQQTVVEAREQLNRAEANAASERKAEAHKKLKQVRTEAKLLRRELITLAGAIEQSDLTLATLRAELSATEGSIARLSAPSPDVLDDPEDYEEDLTALRAYRQEVAAKLQAAQDRAPSRIRAAEVKQELEQLQYVAANLVNLIENNGRYGWQGGVSVVR
jgi:chromosome segregation ATPase